MSRDQLPSSRITYATSTRVFDRRCHEREAGVEFATEFKALTDRAGTTQRGWALSRDVANATLSADQPDLEIALQQEDLRAVEIGLAQHLLKATFPNLPVSQQIKYSHFEVSPQAINRAAKCDKIETAGLASRKASMPTLAKHLAESHVENYKYNDIKGKASSTSLPSIELDISPQSILSSDARQLLQALTTFAADQNPKPVSTNIRCKSVHVEAVTRNTTGTITHIELALEPAELGRVSARLEYHKNQLVLIVSAHDSQAVEALSQDCGLLLRALSSQINGIETMSVIIRQEGQADIAASNGNMLDLSSNKQRQSNASKSEFPVKDKVSEPFAGTQNTTSSAISARVLI